MPELNVSYSQKKRSLVIFCVNDNQEKLQKVDTCSSLSFDTISVRIRTVPPEVMVLSSFFLPWTVLEWGSQTTKVTRFGHKSNRGHQENPQCKRTVLSDEFNRLPLACVTELQTVGQGWTWPSNTSASPGSSLLNTSPPSRWTNCQE